ncbi:hemolysin family protein [Anabaenopsis tanganyikae CS-531]|jgi:CBS domain containing-hemolysin-like protein|uniref:Hemolysin family protein n=2 Tax=Anabaenopsis TaxID=110103 RepID=A0ABT6KIF3_9CYAN|nr:MULTISPECIES: hemolysin family protein [Anabaenopsis]MDB9540762.1 hemolysin family protein [Anabaenopsis arnoldii]MDH6093201.1 hemolysin family protein [Anabaenopsis arnoldii]MDH6100785.1 hemolysin family protein [Anabaenopsis sp. FSS-46]MDH6107109.1 hemolysin family protein [Anabaenopsis tanganyikae CS-531]
MLQLIIIVFVVIFGSALCSATETALFSVSPLRVRQLAQSNHPATLALLAIRENMNRPIATIVIMNNIFNIVGSIITGSIASQVLGDTWLGIFSAILTLLIIMFAEIIPKTIGERYCEQIAMVTALPVTGLSLVFTPLVWIIENVTAPFFKTKKRPTTNEAEIKLLANIGQQEGIIESDEAEMIQRVFRLNDVTAADLMTPRIMLTYIRGNLTLEAAKKDIIASQHTRIIVVDESIDQVIGFALKHNLLTAMVEGNNQEKIANLARKVHFVPEIIRADKLMKNFIAAREHLAVVVDEYGDVAGVVTLEDVLEVITGEIVDETDRTVDLQEIARKKREKMLQSINVSHPS